MFHFIETDTENSQFNRVGYFVLKLFSVLSHVSQVKLNGLGTVFNVWIGDQLINIGLGIFPVNVQGYCGKLQYFLCQFVF